MRALLLTVPGLLFVAGCGSPAPPEIPPPAPFDATAMVEAAFTEYDRNKNGFIEGSELDVFPALKGVLGGVDANRDGKVSKDELRARFESYSAANTGLISVPVSVTLDGVPLADATVQFVPEACMGGTIQEATGKSQANGTVPKFVIDGKEQPGLQPGLYRVKVTRSDAGGKNLPVRYNVQTTLGAEVFGGRGSQPLLFALSSR